MTPEWRSRAADSPMESTRTMDAITRVASIAYRAAEPGQPHPDNAATEATATGQTGKPQRPIIGARRLGPPALLMSRSPARTSEHGATARAADKSATGAAPDTRFRDQFSQVASDSARFRSMMAQVYGPGHDPEAAEALRQRALAGDYGWLPPVRYVSADSLGGALGAYDASNGEVLINADLRGDPMAQGVYVEEAGHHLDTLVNSGDAAGDEGELLRRLLAGETLGTGQLTQIRGEDDRGAIYVDGRRIEVEFWDPDDLKAGFKNAWRDAFAITGDVNDANGELAIHVIENGGEIGLELMSRDLSGAWEKMKEASVEGATLVVEDFLSIGVRGSASTVDTFAIATGRLDERGLTQSQIDYLKEIHGDSIDYSRIRLQGPGSWQSEVIGDHGGICIGNDIYLGKELYDKDGALTAEGLNKLAHEATHARQDQHDGPDYIAQSIVDQTFKSRGGVGTDGAYDWLGAAEAGVPFDQMRPEQQAELAQHIDWALRKNDDGDLDRGDFEEAVRDWSSQPGIQISDEVFEIVQSARETLLG